MEERGGVGVVGQDVGEQRVGVLAGCGAAQERRGREVAVGVLGPRSCVGSVAVAGSVAFGGGLGGGGEGAAHDFGGLSGDGGLGHGVEVQGAQFAALGGVGQCLELG